MASRTSYGKILATPLAAGHIFADDVQAFVHMALRRRGCFWSGVFNLSPIISTLGCHQIASPLMLLRLNSSGLVPLSSSINLILLSSLKCSHSSLSRQVYAIWVLPLIVHLPLLSTSLISHVPPIFT